MRGHAARARDDRKYYSDRVNGYLTMLYDAQEAFKAGDAKADENIRAISTEGKL